MAKNKVAPFYSGHGVCFFLSLHDDIVSGISHVCYEFSFVICGDF